MRDDALDRLHSAGWQVYRDGAVDAPLSIGSSGWTDGKQLLAVHRSGRQLRRASLLELVEAVSTDEPEQKRRVADGIGDVWEWLGDYNPKLVPLVETYLHGSTPDERFEAFNKLDAYRQKASEGRHANTHAVLATLEPRARHRVDELRGGTGSQAELQAKRNPDSIRLKLADFADDHGIAFDNLIAPSKPGLPSSEERQRLDLLGQAVRAMREKGHTQIAIGIAIGRSKQRVAELERRGF